MAGIPFFSDTDDTVVDSVVDALVRDEAAIAALEADRIIQFALAMRVGLSQLAHKPRTVQDREMAVRSIAAEIAVRLRWSDLAVQNRMDQAFILVEEYPATLDALAGGRISLRHAHIIRQYGVPFTEPAERAAYEAVVLEWAYTDTPARTETFARRIAEELHPESITERYRCAEQRRRVAVEDLGDGLGMLTIIDGITKIRAMHDRLTQQAKAIKALPVDPDAPVHDTRTIDQTRADLACDLILTGQPAIDPTKDVLPGGLGAIRAHVQLTIPAFTAAGASDRGASIDGVSPIDADTARALLTGVGTGWERLLTHPMTGAVLAVDTYRPTAAMRRFLAARDVHCRFPACRRPARVCDHDHNTDWTQGGATAVCNLACLCKRHHTLKTETPWTARQHPDGSIVWTSPLGHTAIDLPERYPTVRFVPDPEPDPPPF